MISLKSWTYVYVTLVDTCLFVNLALRFLLKFTVLCAILITESSRGCVVFGRTYIIHHCGVGFYFSPDVVSNFLNHKMQVFSAKTPVFQGYLPNPSL